MLYINIHIYIIYICINANAIASSWRYNFLWPKAELMLKHPKSSLWRYDTRLNNSKRRTVKLSFIAASRYEPWKQALCSRESKHKTLELWWLMLTLLQQLFPNVFRSCVVPTPSARGALERRWKTKSSHVESTDFIPDVWNTSIKQIITDQPGFCQATLPPTAWLPRAKISTVDFSFTKPWDRNTARVQPVKKDIQKT